MVHRHANITWGSIFGFRQQPKSYLLGYPRLYHSSFAKSLCTMPDIYRLMLATTRLSSISSIVEVHVWVRQVHDDDPVDGLFYFQEVALTINISLVKWSLFHCHCVATCCPGLYLTPTDLLWWPMVSCSLAYQLVLLQTWVRDILGGPLPLFP